jgi:hypothetical protein
VCGASFPKAIVRSGRDANPAIEKHEENTMLNGKRILTLALPLVLPPR